MKFKAMAKLLMNKKGFLLFELAHLEKMRKEANEQPPSEPFDDEGMKRIEKKRDTLVESFIWVSFIIILGALLGAYINEVSPFSWPTIRIVRAVSLVLIAWSVLGRLQDMQTMSGRTLLELTSIYLYKWFYSLGLFLGAFTLFLEGVPNS
jgi:hypothetical protein